MSGTASYVPTARSVFGLLTNPISRPAYEPSTRDLFARSTNPINRPLYSGIPIQVLRPTNYYWGNGGG